MKVGCVKEIKTQEYRVGLTPDNVKEYIARGHIVMIEKGAGEGSGFSDGLYAAAGAQIIDSAEKVWHSSDMLIKVKEPLKEEYGLIGKGQIVYTYLHLAAEKKPDICYA